MFFFKQSFKNTTPKRTVASNSMFNQIATEATLAAHKYNNPATNAVF